MAQKIIKCGVCFQTFAEKMPKEPGRYNVCPECTAESGEPEPPRYIAGLADDETGSSFPILKQGTPRLIQKGQ